MQISFGGASASIFSLIKGSENRLIYLDMAGQEDMVRAVSAQIMQGTIKGGDHWLRLSEGYMDLFRDGNRRIIEPLGEGQARAIVFQSRCEPAAGMQFILGEDEAEIESRFKQWLDVLPLPRISALDEKFGVDLEKALFELLVKEGRLSKLRVQLGTMMGYEVDASLVANDYALLRGCMVEVLKRHVPYAPEKRRAELPLSPLLTRKQVKAIYDKLDSMPKTYDLDGVWPKPVGAKLFNSNLTAYIVEADRGAESDEEYGLHPQAYGYMENLSHPDCSEWGYICVEELVELGFEMDLFFDGMLIDEKGQVFEQNTIAA